MRWLLSLLCSLLMLMQGELQAAPTSTAWQSCMERALSEIQSKGAGAYSTKDDAHDALALWFSWDKGQVQFDAAGGRPSFCSGAVYGCVLRALSYWDKSHVISKQAWQSLFPLRYQDGEKSWGWANANACGFAMLIQQLGAGHSFTDWAKARRYDIIKMWWTDKLGATERGHLAILWEDLGDKVIIWSSNQEQGEQVGGFGWRIYPKSSIKRVLFTRITQPKAFNKATQITKNLWLHSLLKQEVSWSDCVQQLQGATHAAH